MLEYLSNTCRVSSSGRATASQAVGGGFESRILLQDLLPYIPYGRSKGRSCGAFCFYRPPGGVFFVLASLYFYLDLYPPGCGALFLLRGTGPACKKQTAAPAPPRLFLPQAAAQLRSQLRLAVSAAGSARFSCPPSGGAGLWFLPHPEGAAPGLEPRQGRGRRPGGSSKGGGRV